jgi:hypothetical protein
MAKIKDTEVDSFGNIMTPEFIKESFQKAVDQVWEQNREQGLDSYCTIDNKVVAVKPDGTIEPVVFDIKRPRSAGGAEALPC